MRFWQQTASWQDFEGLTRRRAVNAEELLRRLRQRFKRDFANLPFAEDLVAAHYCVFDRETPFYVKAALVAAAAYFILPDDLIPDSVPIFGVADDAAVLAGAMKLFSSHIKPIHREAAQQTLTRLRAQ